MQGWKQYEERLFWTVDLTQMVPKSHLLVRVDRVLKADFIYELTRQLYCAGTGRPSIDPVLFFRMQVIRYLFGITSDRKLCEEVHLNLAYRWFCRLNLEDPVPDHSSLTRIRDRFGVETYKAIFERLVAQLRACGLVKAEQVMVDASLVEADASIDSLEEREEGDPEARALREYEQRYHDFKQGEKQRKVSNQTHVSKTDPDATLVSRPGTYRKLYYKAHYAVDGHTRCILDCHATTGARHECIVLPDRIDYLVGQQVFPIGELIADKGYGRGPTYTFLREQGIRAYIPLHDDAMGKGRLTKAEFKYDKKRDCYVCPANKHLYPYEKLKDGSVKRYRVTGGHCRTCSLKEACLPENHKHRARFVYRSPHQEEIDAVKRRQQSAHFKEKVLQRAWKMEGLFGEAKTQHGLRRAKYRGIAKVQIQFYLTAIAQNIKRLASHFSPILWRLRVMFARACPRSSLGLSRGGNIALWCWAGG